MWTEMCSIDALVDCLRTRHYCRVAKPVLREQAVEETSFINAPFVRMLLQEHEDEAILRWYLDNFLFDKLGSIYVLPNGISKPIEEEKPQAPYIKLDILLRVAQYHRAKYTAQEDEILTNEKYRELHHAWRDDWQSWMTQEAQNEWWQHGKHEWTKSRFKNFMFKIGGCAELLQFFLFVPHTYSNFQIFYDVFRSADVPWRPALSRNERLMQAVELVRCARR